MPALDWWNDLNLHRRADMRIASGAGGGDDGGGGGSTYTEFEERPLGPFPLFIRLKRSTDQPSPPASVAAAAPSPGDALLSMHPPS